MDDYEENINVDRAYLGKAGEYLTAGKLLLNGFNVFNGAVDDGIDIVASKNSEFYKIQVKTCQDVEGYDSGKFMASVNLTTLSKHNHKTTFVVFVVHYLNGRISADNAGNHTVYNQDFIVLPVEKIFELTKKQSGHAVLNLKSTLVVETGEDYMYKMTFGKQSLTLDDYLIEAFSQII